MKKNLAKNQNRVWEIDFVRGFIVLLMVFDHFMFLVGDIFGAEWRSYAVSNSLLNFSDFAKNYFYSPLRTSAEPFIAALFFLICGISSTFSKNNLKRGFLLLIISLILSISSYYVMPDQFIHFGVLTSLAFCILIYEFLNRLCNGNKTAVTLLATMLAIILSLINYYGETGAILPSSKLCSIFVSRWAIYNNFYSPGDFFPLFPHLTVMLFGVVIGNVFYKNKQSYLPFDCIVTKPVNFVGRHALYFYFIPQLFFALILMIISKAVFNSWVIF